MRKKYTLTNDTRVCRGYNAYRRIKALIDFSDVKRGDLGGFIENENNLSHDGDCWIYDEAYVGDMAKVYDNAKIFGRARVYGSANISGNATVSGRADVSEHARVCDNARVYGWARVYGNACVSGNANLYGDIFIFGDSCICGNAKIHVMFQTTVCNNSHSISICRINGGTIDNGTWNKMIIIGGNWYLLSPTLQKFLLE